MQRVFDYWVERHTSGKGRSPVLSSERKKKIEKAIKEYGVDTTLRAVDGCLSSGWHMGENPTGTKYNDISLILRNAANIEKFAGLTESEVSVVADSTEWVANLVDRAFATWGIEPSKSRRSATIEAWFPLIGDLDADECQHALTVLALTNGWMPRPSEIRRFVLRDRLSAPPPLEAWLQFQAVQKSVASGTGWVEPHECVVATMRRIGGGSGLHTNGDREMFVEVYRSVVAEFEVEVLIP